MVSTIILVFVSSVAACSAFGKKKSVIDEMLLKLQCDFILKKVFSHYQCCPNMPISVTFFLITNQHKSLSTAVTAYFPQANAVFANKMHYLPLAFLRAPKRADAKNEKSFFFSFSHLSHFVDCFPKISVLLLKFTTSSDTFLIIILLIKKKSQF